MKRSPVASENCPKVLQLALTKYPEAECRSVLYSYKNLWFFNESHKVFGPILAKKCCSTTRESRLLQTSPLKSVNMRILRTRVKTETVTRTTSGLWLQNKSQTWATLSKPRLFDGIWLDSVGWISSSALWDRSQITLSPHSIALKLC